jgi:argininosuccinate lyase
MSDLRGRFGGELDEEMQRYSSSLELDLELAHEDIAGSLAHVRMLGEAGVLNVDEALEIAAALERIDNELADGSWTPDEGHDDIHMAVEARLVELIGALGGKLHTARSRNDQVATAVRLWLKRRLGDLDNALCRLISTLLDRVEGDGRTLMPGYTHLQRGQPILLGHHLLAHAWALSRDRERLASALGRVDRSPLGACAMAGTSHPIDREATARALGFSGVAVNAMDAVSTRDHLQEVAAVCAIAMGHLSRMAAELVLWSSSEFDFVRIGEAHATGSSIMPQKRNPDGAELVRGKAGRVLGDLQAVLVLTKGLPLAYNRDLQEDRAPIIDALDQCESSLKIMAAMWSDLEVHADRFEEELRGDFSLATELADLLVEKGVPFRTAHEAVGAAVRWCEEQSGNLSLLDGGAARQFHESFPDDLEEWLDPRASAERKTTLGGTAWSEIHSQLEALRSSLSDRILESL